MNDRLSNQQSRITHIGPYHTRSDLIAGLKEAVSAFDSKLDLNTFLCPEIDTVLLLDADFSVEDYIHECAASMLVESKHAGGEGANAPVW